MGLRLKFNLVLLLVFAVGLGVTGYISYDLLHRNARDEVMRNAGIMMEAALSMRSYTSKQIGPLIPYSADAFHPQTVPAYSATEIMGSLREKYADYSYKEATLNPTNPLHKAVAWEAEIVNAFRSAAERSELSGVRDTPAGRFLYVARPLQITDKACLVCLDTAAWAPPAMVKIYGPNNGFGWQHMEVIGAQIVLVPMSLPVKNANHAFYTFMVSLSLVFLLLFAILNVMMNVLIVRPIMRMSEAAARVGKGDLKHRIDIHTGDELEAFAAEFNRTAAQLMESHAGLESKVEARTRELASANAGLTEALGQQTATAEVLKIISRSTFDLQPVLQTLMDSAARLCRAKRCVLFQQDGEVYRASVTYNTTPELRHYLESNPITPGRGTVSGRAALEGRVVHVHDVRTDAEYQWGEGARLGDYRTVLSVPLLREGVPIGVIVLTRDIVEPFSDREIDLVNTFADQAVIAIENVRLLHEIQDKSRQLELASLHKSQFLANMSHELRTPLNAIIGYSEMLQEDAAELQAEQFVADLQKIQASGQHLLELINAVLDLSKIEAGKMELYLESFNVASVVAGVTDVIKPLAQKKSNRLVIECAENAGIMHADLTKVRQALFNLLSNACKFTENGTVTMKVERQTYDGHEGHNSGDWIVVSVHDTGIGMTPEQIGRLFQAFSQADASTTREFGGTGLGLALSRHLCQMMGGDITVQSEPGSGSTFTLRLPATVKDAALKGAEARADVAVLPLPGAQGALKSGNGRNGVRYRLWW